MKQTNNLYKTKKDLESIVILGIISGVFGGLIVAFSQELAKVYTLSFIWVVAIAIFVLIILIFFVALSNSRKENKD